ncbi:hypothetical protein AX16_005403 [Volvariella volvacea WC 439]|nr:hypothetical protein AX16_005403 [Volvariella volvacea WC 439]
MTMREFGEKYAGNVQAALRGYQRERLLAAGGDSNFGEIDKTERKRKWIASTQEAEPESSANPFLKDHEGPRASKTARTQSPVKPRPGPSTGLGTSQRPRPNMLNRTPSTSRKLSRIPASPSPQKIRPPFTTSIRPPSRPASPTKPTSMRPNPPISRVPSSSTFNPTLPIKAPVFPTGARLPRKDEHMLSVNGSPIANPYDLGLPWFSSLDDQTDPEDETGLNEKPRLKRVKSNIRIRRDPSVAFGGIQSRTASQTSSSSLFQAPSSSQTTQSAHSSSSQPNSRYPGSLQVRPSDLQTPKPMRSFSAIVAIPTKDGHILEFNPLETSPSALDALEGISDSAKKQARLEMGRLVQSVDKWKLS